MHVRLPTNPVAIAAVALAILTPLAFWQAKHTDRPGKKLALISQRAQLEALSRDEVYRQALALKGKLKDFTEQDELFRGATVIWLSHSLSDDLKRPTVAEDAALPLGEGVDAARRLTPGTAFEGGRIRALYESRLGKERDQLPILVQIVARSSEDDDAIRAYVSALRGGSVDERRKAVELARDYARRRAGSPLSRLTLLLALSSSLSARRLANDPPLDPKDRAEAQSLAASLLKDVPATSLAHPQVESLARETATLR